LGLLQRQWLLLVLVRPLFALLVVAEMDVVVVWVVPLVMDPLVAVPDGAPAGVPVLAGAPVPAAVATMAMAMALEVALAGEVALAQAALNLAAVPNQAYNTAAQFLGMWNNCATDVACQNLEQLWPPGLGAEVLGNLE
jgi:hypothetical protein